MKLSLLEVLPSKTLTLKFIFRVNFRATIVIFLFLVGCGLPDPLLEYSLNSPSLILAPADRAGINDGRGRFRENYCAVQEDHGDSLPDNAPCENDGPIGQAS